jgi:myosin heavy subunit
VKVAHKHKNWALASLAVRVKLDAFTKVKEAMDKMMAELKAQQKAEYEKNEQCKADLDSTEDKIKVSEQTKADLDEENKDYTNTIAKLTESIAELKKEVADMEVSLKEAGENRKAENQLYQTTMSDQRATIAVLNMALSRMKEFYTPKASLATVGVHSHQQVEPPPPTPGAYEKSASAGGVLQLLAKIISDAEATEAELKISEQKSQEEYAAFVASTTSSIEADRVAIAESEKQSASASSSLAETEESQLANDAELKKLEELLGATHADCDWIMKYFDLRQKSRAEEMDAIEEAKAILSGADFA